VFKKRRRKTMRVSRGHRSTLTKVEIKAIEI
jgi:ribosomal protein L21